MSIQRNKLFKKGIITALILCSVGVFLFLGAGEVLTQTDFGIAEIETETSLATTDIRVIIARIIRAVLGLLGIIAVVIVMYGGYVYMTSGGNEEKIAQAKKILLNGAIGLAIILSAFTIAQFILNALTDDGGNGSPGGPGGAPPYVGFSGSGSLGHVVKDHFPFRDQTDVYRNTWISVTFREPINPATIIENTNKTCWGEDGARSADPTVCENEDGDMIRPEYYGDCIEADAGVEFDWTVHCDQLKTDALEIYPSEAEAPLPLVLATAGTVYDADNLAYGFTFRPHELLGSAAEEVWYTANLTDNVKKQNGDDAFEGTESHYEWEFRTNTTLDLTPPQIESISPAVGESVARNKIVKITFNERVNPLNVQGVINNASGDSFTNIIFNNTDAQGEWKISNGYRTVEFIPSIPCGTNSCGDTIYCLTTGCAADATECTQSYKTLVRTASLFDPTESWAALPPGDGVMDMAGNVLDGKNLGVKDDKPTLPGDPTTFDEGAAREERADNYFWDFVVENRIELKPLYVHQISPSVDESYVAGQRELSITFDSGMTYHTLGDILLEEYPARAEIPGSGGENLPDIWSRSLAHDSLRDIDGDGTSATSTKVTIDHRDFGPNSMDLYYFTSIPSTVLNDYGNCMYPGRGPDFAPGNTCVYTEDDAGVGTSSGCLPDHVEFDFADPDYPTKDTGCAHHDPGGANLTDNLESCINVLETISPSTF